jgi:hypothetical protein
MMPGFRHIPFNDLEAARNAISPATVAIMIEGVQGEGGVTPATPEYLLGLRALCDEKKLLLLMDGVQCGHFARENSRAFSGFWKAFPAAKNFCPTDFRWPSRSAADFPSARSGCARRSRICLGRARTARRLAARRSPARSR